VLITSQRLTEFGYTHKIKLFNLDEMQEKYLMY